MKPDSQSRGKKRCRASGPKTKTGCITCRQRRVKCDEWRPYCIRCRKSGITCRGYETALSSSALTTTRDGPQISLPPADLAIKNEIRAMAFYGQVVAPQMAGWQCNSFWKDVVVQISYFEPIVRHSLVCLSNLYESICNDGSAKFEVCEKQLYGLTSYNFAIRNFYEQMQRGISVPVTLIVCLIFISIDLLRQDHAMAMKHYEIGLVVLQNWKNEHGNDLVHTEYEIVIKVIGPVFSSLRWMAYILGRPDIRVPFGEPKKRGNQTFQSVMEATIEFHRIIAPTIDFMTTARIYRYQTIPDKNVIFTQTTLLTQHQEWIAMVEQSIPSPQFSNSATGPQEVEMLVICSHFVKIWLEVCIEPTESSWDQHKELFGKLLQTSELMIGNTTTLKCRWPALRRQAIHLLRHVHRRECFIDSLCVANLCEQAIAIEEECFNLETGQDPPEDQVPPETARIHHIDITPLPLSSQGTPVNFLTKPNGLQGPWHIRSEYVQLGNLDSVKALNTIISLHDNNQRVLWNGYPPAPPATIVPMPRTNPLMQPSTPTSTSGDSCSEVWLTEGYAMDDAFLRMATPIAS